MQPLSLSLSVVPAIIQRDNVKLFLIVYTVGDTYFIYLSIMTGAARRRGVGYGGERGRGGPDGGVRPTNIVFCLRCLLLLSSIHRAMWEIDVVTTAGASRTEAAGSGSQIDVLPEAVLIHVASLLYPKYLGHFSVWQ